MTAWHRDLTEDDFFLGPTGGATWTRTTYSLSNVGGTPEYMYLGDVASDESQCTIGGLAPIDDNGDLVTDSDSPLYPRWEGTVSYTNGVDTITFDVVIKLLFTFSWNCDGSVNADSFTWLGTTLTQTSGPTPGGSDTYDYPVVQNGNIGGAGTLVDCNGTVTSIGNFPDLPITAQYDPDCIQGSS